MNKKKYWIACFLLFSNLILVPVSFSASIAWQSYSSQVFINAKNTDKNILLYGKTTWCHFCKKMNGTLQNSKIVSTINSRFIPVIIDIDNNASIAKQYNITHLPTFIILDANNKIIDSFFGYMTAAELMKKLK